MTHPRISVIIPAYNQGAYLGHAVESVLQQTFPDFELLIVDDGSTDSTPDVAASFADLRVKLIRQANQGLPGARNTGLKAATGDYIAFLDSDDAFHPLKLEAHVRHLDQNPQLGLSYASRIEVDGEGKPSWLLRAPEQVSMKDLVLGFPFTINDIALRREWIEKAGGFDDRFRLHSEDRDFYLRLGLAGCEFGMVRQFVAYRRLHPRRQFSKIPERIQTMLAALDTGFDDPRCPAEVLAVRPQAYAKVYLVWGCQELIQGEGAAGQAHLVQAGELDKTLFARDESGRASQFLRYLIWHNVRDGSDHVEPVEQVFACLPQDLSDQVAFKDWALGQGYLIRGMRAVVWGQTEEGKFCFDRAVALGSRLEKPVFASLTDQLTGIEMEYGWERANQALKDLTPSLKRVATEGQIRALVSVLSMMQVYKNYHSRQYAKVPAMIARAIWNDPAHLRNRGTFAILARSLARMVRPS